MYPSDGNVCSVCVTDMVRCTCSRRTVVGTGPPPGLHDRDRQVSAEASIPELMQDVLESNAPEDVVEMRDVGNLAVDGSNHDRAGQSQTTIAKLIERLGNVGLNARRSRIPARTDLDYDTNDRDTFEFLSVVIGSCDADQLKYEVLRKFRLGSRVVHPDKTAHFSADVIAWSNNMMTLVSQAKDEALWRLERLKVVDRGSKDFVLQNYMEFNERFQQTLLDYFKPTIMMVNTSDMRYAAVGCDSVPPHALEPGVGRMFYQNLFDFNTTPKQDLADLLRQALGSQPAASLHGSTFVVAFARTPREFPEWFQKELIKIRASGISIFVVALLLAPPLPCTWKEMSVLSGSVFNGNMFNTFRLQDTYFAPNALTVVTAGASPRKVLKKIRAITFCTGPYRDKLADNFLSWRKGVLQSFASAHRLIFDFNQDNSLVVQALVQVLASQHDGDTHPNVYPSFGSTLSSKRKMCHISFAPSTNKPDDVNLLGQVKQTLQAQGMAEVLVGWEHDFLLPEDCYVLTFIDNSWTINPGVRTVLLEVVMASATKAIIKTDPGLSIEQLKHVLSGFNRVQGAVLRKLQGYDGHMIWQEYAQFIPDLSSVVVSTSVEICLDNAPAKEYKNLVTQFLSMAQNSMVECGFDFGTSGIIAEWSKMRRKRVGPVPVVFPSIVTARGFHFQFKDMEWESDNGTQTIIVRLQHLMFDNELLDPQVRLVVNTVPKVTPQTLNNITNRITN